MLCFSIQKKFCLPTLQVAVDNQKEKTGIWKNLLPPKWSNNVCKTLCFSLYAHLWLFKVNLYVCACVSAHDMHSLITSQTDIYCTSTQAICSHVEK